MASETELLQTLILAATGAPDGPGWDDLLRQLAETTRAETVSLSFERQGRGLAAWHHGPAPALVLAPGDSARMRLGRVYAQGDLPGRPPHRRPLRAIRTAAGPEGSALLLLQRGPRHEAEDFRAIDGVQLSALAPVLGPALTGWQAGVEARARASRDAGLARALGAGWILFSPGGQVLDQAPDLGDLLAPAGLRLTPEGRLALPNSDPAAEELSARLRNTLARATPDSPPALLVLARSPRLEMLITARPDGPRLARLRLSPRAAALPVPTLARHFGLAPSEARLAQRICDGLSLAEAADDLGWTLESARSASKQVFARMGVRGQAGVIRRMQAGALWLQAEVAGTEGQADGQKEEGGLAPRLRAGDSPRGYLRAKK